ncbi:MAG: Gfo/Idh/MocA family oxidoreductase [Anaerolineae bacterium]|nr:Gfo/Idh/MocA family oxidoreductase [Anaerolineae bacterium]
MKKLRVGIVGCGEATQILHLPSLYQLRDKFEAVALCDISRTVMNGVGNAWQIPAEKRFLDYQELIAQDDVDAVLIANPNAYHKEIILAAISAGKHVLVEKPMCITLEDADEIIAADAVSDCVVQVGTMRRYSPSFVSACQLVKEMEDINLCQVHDVIGRNSQFIEATSNVIHADDITSDQIEALRQRTNESITAAIGVVPDALRNTYNLLLGLSTHDISAMRELIGMPERVLYAAQKYNGGCITAAFDYGTFICHFETGTNAVAEFNAYLQVNSRERVVRVEYDTPYVRNLPIYLEVLDANGRHGVKRTRQHTWSDPFVEEWLAFYDNVMNKKTPKTSPQDFRHDLELFQMMIDQMER